LRRWTAALLSQNQIVALVGSVHMALVVTANSTSDASLFVDDHGCLSLGSVGAAATYASSGYLGMRGNQFSTPNAVAADITQIVVAFPRPAACSTKSWPRSRPKLLRCPV
jgi:PknH-like extracellular domain